MPTFAASVFDERQIHSDGFDTIDDRGHQLGHRENERLSNTLNSLVQISLLTASSLSQI